MMAYVFFLSFFALGLVAGVMFFAVLKRTVRLLVTGGSAWRVGVLYVARIVIAGAAFYWAARTGTTELLIALVGFTVARLIFLNMGSAR